MSAHLIPTEPSPASVGLDSRLIGLFNRLTLDENGEARKPQKTVNLSVAMVANTFGSKPPTAKLTLTYEYETITGGSVEDLIRKARYLWPEATAKTIEAPAGTAELEAGTDG